MPTLADFQKDYWAPDRDAVLAQMAAQQQQQAAPPVQQSWGAPGQSFGGGQLNYAQGGGGVFGGGGGGPRMSDEQAQQFFDQLFPGQTVSPADLAAHRQELEAAGIHLNANASGQITDLTLPSGNTVDPIYGAGAGINKKQWLVNPGGGGGGGGYGGGIGFAPNSTPFSYKDFVPPTGLTEENDPGYQARLALGNQAIERSAASQGTLLTGGTMKDLNQFGQTFASNEFQNVYDRALNAYNRNYQTAFEPWQANYNQAYQTWAGNLGAQNQRYNQLMGNAQMGLGAAGALAGAGQNAGNQSSNLLGQFGNQLGQNITGAGNAAAAGQVGSANAWSGLTNNLGNAALAASLYGGGGNKNLYGNNEWANQKMYGLG